MQGITKKIRDNALKEFKPMMEEMAQEGISKEQIVRFFKAQCDLKIKQFYRSKLSDIRQVLNGIKLEDSNPDSKAEALFYNDLQQNQIPFKFHHQIGAYTADYLINDSVVVELDGAQHNPTRDEKRDIYLRKMGYKVIRIPIWIYTLDRGAVMETLKEVYGNRK